MPYVSPVRSVYRFGRWVVRLRRALKWRQEDLAHAIGADPMTVSRWERGIQGPSVEYAAKLAEAAQRYAPETPSLVESLAEILGPEIGVGR